MSYSYALKRALTPLIAATLLIGGLNTAQAALTHDLEITGSNLSGSGQVTFNTSSGSDTSGVSAFSFSGGVDLSAIGLGITFFNIGTPDLTQIFWNIDNAWNLSIGFSTGDLFPDPDDIGCMGFLINSPFSVSCSAGNAGFSLLPGSTGAFFVAKHNLNSLIVGEGSSSTPVHGTNAVPEPSSIILLGTGLAYILARRKKQAA